MTTWALPKNLAVDAVTGATPLAGGAYDGYLALFLGNIGGSLGETCKIALLLGGIYLVVRRIITPTIPLAFMGTVVVLSAILGQDPLFHLLSGGVVLGAIFMATDYVTSPTTERGKLIFGIGCGLITIVIRLYAGYPEGVSFAILLMNIVSPLIDRYTPIKAFGAAKGGGSK
jgi:electron transport complex protein RnfD